MVRVDVSDLQEFCRARSPRLVGAVIRRLRCTRYGLLLECHQGTEWFEWSFLGCRDAVWCLVGEPDQRDSLLSRLRSDAPDLTRPCHLFGAAEDDATALDALRLWLVQPTARPPEWFALEGCTIRHLEHPAHERVVLVTCESRTPTGEVQRLVLRAELIPRRFNLLLADDADQPRANWQGREAAAPRRRDDGPQALEEASTIDQAARAWRQFAAAASVDLLQEARRAARRQRRRLHQLVRGLERDLAQAERAADWRRKGELLAAHLHRVRRGQSRVQLPDWDDPEVTVDVELDPGLSPQENVARFFKRAKRGERGQDTIAARLQAARDELARVPGPDGEDEAGTADWNEALRDASDAWVRARDADPGATRLRTLWAPGGPPWKHEPASRPATPQKDSRPSHPGRRFVLAGGWEVYVGRSNAENDELTHRFAHPQDVWLHAGGVAGSHVVLRMRGSTDNPPRDILEQAAAIAARFSKAKHAGTVPVIWTRKRHVRKPRGSKPGLAVCQQEKTVFVKPGLPPDTSEEDT
jgi:hypothetical protein